MTSLKNNILLIIITLSFLLFSPASFSMKEKDDVCPSKEQYAALDLPTGYNVLFAGSGECIQCHNSQVDNENNDISIVGWWRSSMMANSAKDPFWRAKVSYEKIKNPGLTEEIETTCLRCHAPMGVFNAFHNGQTHYSLAELDADPIAKDGVSCTVCHQIKPESLGNYSGNIEFGTDHEIWGPYDNMFGNPMINHTGYTPKQGLHIKDSELCASCHTVITPTIDMNGQATGTEFVEQAIYQEWKNSESFDLGVSCQSCHLPELDESIVISSMPPWLTGQNPFGLHELVGANVFMLNILKDNAAEVGLNASDEEMDATIARTLHKLQQASIQLNLEIANRDDDSLFVDVRINNLAGHKVPAGYPSRQVFVQFIAKDEQDNTLFTSGLMDDDFNIIHENEDFEPHHQMINSEEDVQIYQMVMANTNNEVTTTLMNASHQLKDNRLPPVGFHTSHESYDTIKIVGFAENDPTFNPSNEGGDIVKYHFPINQYQGKINIEVKVFYQTVNNKWLADMFAESSDEINSFHAMYEAADKNPILMQSKTIISQATGLNEIENNLQIYPNPTSTHITIVNYSNWEQVKIYHANGQFINEMKLKGNSVAQIQLPQENGIYLLEFENELGLKKTKKILKI